MTFLDLCAGIGGFSLGLEWAGMTCKGQVEIDAHCNRIPEKHWPRVSRWGDIRLLDPACLPAVDLIAGGYPCQPFSHAGKRKGAEDDRHIWPFIRKIVAHIRPSWCLFENVAGHITLGLDAVLSDLESEGYSAVTLDIPACAVDAPHIRRRVWILAHAERPERRPGESAGHVANGHSRQREEAPSRLGTSGSAGRERILADSQGGAVRPGLCAGDQTGERGATIWHGCSQGGSLLSDAARFGRGQGRAEPENRGETRPGVDCRHVPNADGAGCEEQHIAAVAAGTGFPSRPFDPGWCQWATEPGVGRVAHGIPRRVDRIKGLGNAVVPQLVCEIGCAIRAAHYGGA